MPNLIPLSPSDINTTVNHEPRILDVRLGEALGFARPRKIRDLVAQHRETLEKFGEIVSTAAMTHAGTRPTAGRVFWLSERQALFLCTKSETPNATEITIQMVEVFYQVKRGGAEQPLGPVDLLAEYATSTKAEIAANRSMTLKSVEGVKGAVMHYLRANVLDWLDLRFRAVFDRDVRIIGATQDHSRQLASMHADLAPVLKLARVGAGPETLVPSEWVGVTGVYRLAGVTEPVPQQRSLSVRTQRSLDAFCIATYRQIDIRNSGFGRTERIWRITAVKAWLKVDGLRMIRTHIAKSSPPEQAVIPFPSPSGSR